MSFLDVSHWGKEMCTASVFTQSLASVRVNHGSAASWEMPQGTHTGVGRERPHQTGPVPPPAPKQGSPGGSPRCSGAQLWCGGGCSSGSVQALQPQLKSSCLPTGQPGSLPKGTVATHSCAGSRLAMSTCSQTSKNREDAHRVLTETIVATSLDS